MSIFGRSARWLLRQLRNHFLTGIVITVPIGITILILIWLFDLFDNILQPLVVFIVGHPIRGVGFAVLIVLIYIIGVVVSNFVGKRLYHYTETFVINKIPGVKQLYQGIKQVMESFSKPDKSGFLKVVMIEFPRKGTWMVGFITNQVLDESGNKIYHVFVPHSPNPITGFVLMLKEDEVIYTNMTVEDAFKLVVSAGRYTADESSLASQIYNKDVDKSV